MPISSKTARDIHTELRINPINAVSVMSQYQNLSSDYSNEQQQRHLVTKTITKGKVVPKITNLQESRLKPLILNYIVHKVNLDWINRFFGERSEQLPED